MQSKVKGDKHSSLFFLVNVTKLELVVNLSFIICRNSGHYAIVIIYTHICTYKQPIMHKYL